VDQEIAQVMPERRVPQPCAELVGRDVGCLQQRADAVGERVPPRGPLLRGAVGRHHRVVVELERPEEAVDVGKRGKGEECGKRAVVRAYFSVHAEGILGPRLGQGSLDRSFIL
jgi:hypothetical protein